MAAKAKAKATPSTAAAARSARIVGAGLRVRASCAGTSLAMALVMVIRTVVVAVARGLVATGLVAPAEASVGLACSWEPERRVVSASGVRRVAVGRPILRLGFAVRMWGRMVVLESVLVLELLPAVSVPGSATLSDEPARSPRMRCDSALALVLISARYRDQIQPAASCGAMALELE